MNLDPEALKAALHEIADDWREVHENKDGRYSTDRECWARTHSLMMRVLALDVKAQRAVSAKLPEEVREMVGRLLAPIADDRGRIGGWAAGNYYNTCGTCGEQFQGDKRAIRCRACATNSMFQVRCEEAAALIKRLAATDRFREGIEAAAQEAARWQGDGARIAKAIRALLPAPTTTSGWKLVPEEPTPEMLEQAGNAFLDATVAHVAGDHAGSNTPFKRFYRAMIAAAPPVKP